MLEAVAGELHGQPGGAGDEALARLFFEVRFHLAVVKDHDQARVVESCHGPDFLAKGGAKLRILSAARVQNLDRYRQIPLNMDRSKDLSHPSFPQGGEEAKGAEFEGEKGGDHAGVHSSCKQS